MKKIFSSFLFLFFVLSNALAYDNLYMIGSATSAGWDSSNPIVMNKVSDGFEYTCKFNTGEMKFLTQKKWENAIGPDYTSGSRVSGTICFNELVRNKTFSLVKFSDGKSHTYSDYKFEIKTAGWYTVHVKADGSQVSTYPVYIYPVGNGCSVGWSTSGNVKFTETSFASGKYTGSVYLTKNGGQEFKFLCAKTFENTAAIVGPKYNEAKKHDISAVSIVETKIYVGSDVKFWVVASSMDQNVNMTLDMKAEKLYVVKQTPVAVNAYITDSAKNMLTNGGKSISLFWWNDVESGTASMSLEEGKWSGSISGYHMPVKFLIYNGKFNDQGGVQTVDMTNGNNGHTADTCVSVSSHMNGGKLKCEYNPNCEAFNSITVRAQLTPAAKAKIGNKVMLHAWPSVEPEDSEMKPVAGKENWYEATVDVTGVLKFLIHDGTYAHKTADITNGGAGFTEDVCVNVRGGNLAYEINPTCADFTPYEFAVKAQFSQTALDSMDNVVNCHVWTTGTEIATDYTNLTADAEGFYTCNITSLDPVSFNYFGKDQVIWTEDMTNDNKGHVADTCVVITSTINSGKLKSRYSANCETFKMITVRAQFTPAAKAKIGNKVMMHSWPSVEPEDIEMTAGEGLWYEATVQVMGNISFVLHNGGYAPKTVDITNGGEGFSDDVCVNIKDTSLTVEMNPTCADLTPYQFNIKAQMTKEALKDFKDTVNCHTWIAGTSIANDYYNMVLGEDGFYSCAIETYDPIRFCLYGKNWCRSTVDMLNDGVGYTADKCVNVISRIVDEKNQKVGCYHNDNCDLASTNTINISTYVDPAATAWTAMRYFTQGVGDQSQYNGWFTPLLTKGADGWYNYAYVGESSLTWVATASFNWDTQIDDIANISEDKLYYISSEKKGNNHYKVVELTEKPEPVTFTFRFTDVAAQTWQSEDVYVAYTMIYKTMDEESASAHTAYLKMTEEEGVYSCSIMPLAPITFRIQSYAGGEAPEQASWTVNSIENCTASADYIIKDYNSGHLIETYSEDQLSVHITTDGFATACWDRNWAAPTGVDAYMGEYRATDQTLYLTIIRDGIVPANAGVVLYGPDRADEVIALQPTTAQPGSYDSELNKLLGTTESTDRPQSGTTYVLAKYPDQNTMLYQFTGATIPANKAYLNIAGSGAPARIRMVTRNTPTGLNVNVNANVNENRKVMIDGQLIIIRDGKQYNAQGALLK